MLELAHSRKIEGVLQMRWFELNGDTGEPRHVHRSDESPCGYTRLRETPAGGWLIDRLKPQRPYAPDPTDDGDRTASGEALDPLVSHTFVRFPRRRDV